MDSNTLSLKPGTRLRTGGTTYEVTKDAKVPAGIVPVVPQPARLLKVYCETCGYTARITQRWITKAGTPDCPSGHGNMVVAPKKEREAPKAEAPKLPAPPKVKRNAPPVAPPVVTPDPDPVDYIDDEPDYVSALDQLTEDVEPESTSTLAQLLADV